MDIKDPRAQKLVLTGIVLAGVGYLYFFATFVPFGYRAMSAEKKELQDQYEQLSSDLNKARQTLSSMARVEKEFSAIQSKYEAARRLLPEEKEVANLLRMVSLVGQQAGVDFELFRPQAVVDRGYYTENPVEVKVSGDYHEVGGFLADVANLSRIVKVTNLNLATRANTDAAGTVSASFTAAAFTLNPNPTPDPAANGKTEAGGKKSKDAAGKGSGKTPKSTAGRVEKKAREAANGS